MLVFNSASFGIIVDKYFPLEPKKKKLINKALPQLQQFYDGTGAIEQFIFIYLYI